MVVISLIFNNNLVTLFQPQLKHTSNSTNKLHGHYKMSTSNVQVTLAAQLAYDTYLSFLEMIKSDTRLVEVNKVQGREIPHKGIEYKINFKIEYVPNGSKINCKTDVLESPSKQLEVLNVHCDCCLEWNYPTDKQ